MSYTNLEIVNRSRDMMMEIYKLTLQLSGMQTFQEGHTIQDPVHALNASIFKEYEKRRYNYEFFKFLVNAYASENLNIARIETIFENGALTDERLYEVLKSRFECLVRIIQGFKQSEDALLSAQ